MNVKIPEITDKSLKPCPFCGSEVKIRIAPLMQTVMFVCGNCGADVCFYGGEYQPEANDHWNRRAVESEVTENG